MISAIEWIPEGVADPNPKKYEFSAPELELIEMMEQQNFGGEKAAPKQPKQKKSKKPKEKIEHSLPADLRMDEYSSDEDENDAVQGTAVGNLLLDSTDMLEEEEQEQEEEGSKDHVDKDDNMDSDSDDDDDLNDVPDTREYTPLDMEGLNNLGLSHVGTNAPAYMDMNENGEEADDDDSDIEDVLIQPGDALFVVAKTEEDFASLEVNVYEQTTGNLFVHHDIPLPNFPLCLAHGDISPTGSAGNYCAVGTFGPGIEVWNLDVLNALEPSCVLGGEDTSMADEIMRHNMMQSSSRHNNNTTKLEPHDRPQLKPGSHTDAVMSLSWNKVHRQVIASGSADCTVKLWDVTQPDRTAGTLTHHKDKVQSVVWHPQEGTLLATGSYDRTVALVDAREGNSNVRKVKLPADCEVLAWDPFQPQLLTAASEDGTISCWDVRKFSNKTPLWSMVANEYGGVSDISYNPNVPGMMVSCSVDKTVVLWDTTLENNKKPQACGSKDMAVGKLYTVNFYPSSPWLLGCGGNGKEIALWDLTRETSIQKRFGHRSVVVNNNAASGIVEGDEETTKDEKQEALDAMMINNNNNKNDSQVGQNEQSTATETPFEKRKKNKKKKAGGKKKKAHKAGSR
eukprot:scaffold2042_cov123-Cylindrotheca_fusiformis.AAC.3